MKTTTYILLVLIAIGAIAQGQTKKRLTYEVTSVKLKGEEGYLNIGNADTMKAQPEIRQFARCIADGRFITLERFFPNVEAYQKFINEFSYDGTLIKMKPLKVISIGKSELEVENRITKEKTTIKFTLNTIDETIEDVILPTRSNLRIEESLPLNYVMLPDNKATEKLNYFTTITDAFHYNPELDFNLNELMFGQIDFADLEIKLNYCYDAGIFGKSCGDKTYNYGLGPVISGKDLDGYSYDEQIEAFIDITDITAFSTFFDNGSGGPVPYLPNNYILTAVIVDRAVRSLVFFREGLEPWQYNGEAELGKEIFAQPIAAKVLNQTIYVLDKGNQWGAPACIHALRINHSANGDYSVNYIGIINTGGLQLKNPTDVGGFLGSSTLPHTLMVSDANGIHLIPINDGTITVSGTIKTINQLQDPLYKADFYSIANAKRIDGDKIGGSTIIITSQNEIIAVSNDKLNNSIVSFDNKKNLFGNSDITNLAYMNREKVWCLTDNTGKLHKLDQYGRYMGGNGTFGTNESNGELFWPIGLTPNPIADISNPYRYRFIVANRWGIETGMKLFAPIYAFTDLKVFENLNDQKLTIAFTSSGMWQAVEGSRSIKFDGFSINGVTIPETLWNTSITPVMQTDFTSETDFLNGVPNTAEFSPTVLTSLKRGWNKIRIQASLSKIINGNQQTQIVFKEANFYWLPSSFTTVGINSLNLDDYTLNKDGFQSDFIYKPITMLGKAIFYVNEGHVVLGKLGILNVENGTTFFSKFHQEQVLSNFSLDPNGKINVKEKGFICIQTGTDKATVYSLPSLTPSFVLNEKYILGTNPTLPGLIGNACESPCQFLAYKKPSISFIPNVIPATANLGLKVNVTDINTSYCEKHKWEVFKNSVLVASKEITGPAMATELSQTLGYVFDPCSDYEIRLSIGCNDIDFIPGNKIKISTKPLINAGIEDKICETNFPYQLTGFQPLSSNGYGTTPGKSYWHTDNTNISVTVGGLVSINSTTSRNVVIKLLYTYNDFLGCSVTSEKNLFVSPTPLAPQLNVTSFICEEQSFEIRDRNTQTGKYIWSGPNNFNYEWYSGYLKRESANKAIMEGKYSAFVRLNGCDGPTGDVNVIINPLPIITIDAEKHFCPNSPSYTFQANVSPTGGSGVWTGTNVLQTGNVFTFAPQQNGVGEYFANFKYIAPITGCQKTVTQKLIVGPGIQLGPNETVCQNSTPFMPSVVSPTGGTWSDNGVNLTGNLFDPKTKQPGTFSLLYTYTDTYNCKNTATKFVTVKLPQTVTILQTEPKGVQYKYYENNTLSSWGGMPTFSSFSPAKTGTLSGIDLSAVPVGRSKNFGIVYEASLNIQAPGNYTFYMNSVDGSKLFINGTLVVNNDGIHGLQERQGSIVLTTGKSTLKLESFNSNGAASISLNWSGPGIVKQTIPQNYFSYPLLFCEDAGIKLTASTGSNFLWSNGATTGPDLLVTKSGIYSVAIKDQDGCPANSNSIEVASIPSPFNQIVTTTGVGYDYKYYENNTGSAWGGLPDFNTLTPIKTGNTPTVNLALRNRDMNFGFVFETQVYLPVDGSYNFFTSSDDGSWLHVDNNLVVNNNGQHATQERSGSVTLTKGFHNVRISFFQAWGGISLSASYQGPGITKQIIPTNVSFRPSPTCLISPVSLAVGSASSYKWNTGEIANIITVNSSGKYSVEVTNENGCKTIVSKTIVVDYNPTVSIITSSPNVACFENFTSGLLIANPSGKTPFLYQWTKDGTSIQGAVSQSYTATTSGTYCVKFSDLCGTTTSSNCFRLDVVKQPTIALSTDIVGSQKMCASGATANIKIDVTNYDLAKTYDVTINPGNTTTLTPNPTTGASDDFTQSLINPNWKFLNTNGRPDNQVSIVNGQLNIANKGNGIWQSNNEVTSIWRNDLVGDVDIKVKMISQSNSDQWARAGILLANDANNLNLGGYCLIAVTPGNGIVFQYDQDGNGQTDGYYSLQGNLSTPKWLRIKKAGKTFTGFYSSSSATGPWIQIGQPVTINSTLVNSNVSLFAASNNINSISSVLMDDFAATSTLPLVQVAITKPGTYTISVKDKTGNNTCPVKPASITIGSNPNPVVSANLSVTELCFNAQPIALTDGTPAGGIWSGTSVSKVSTPYSDDFNTSPLSTIWKVADTDNWTGSTVSVVNNGLQIQARGQEFWQNQNEFVSAYRNDITGDFDVSVKIGSQTNTNAWAKAGIMLANDFTNISNGGLAIVAVTPGSGFLFQYDLNAPLGQMDNRINTGGSTFPCWLRLRKIGNYISAFYRTNINNPWIQIGTDQIPLSMQSNLQIGLFASSSNSSQTTIVNFDDFTSNKGKDQYNFVASSQNSGSNTLTYSVKDNNGCSGSVSKSINVVNTIPTISLGPDIIVEKNVPVTLNATANANVTWSTGATGNSLTYTPTTTTTLSASATNVCGNASDDIILIDPCSFTGYKANSDATIKTPVLKGTLTGGGIFSGIYYLESTLKLLEGIYIFKPGTIILVNGSGTYDPEVAIELGIEFTDPQTPTMLKLDGVKMQSACDKMWGGIRVNKGTSLYINQEPQSIRTSFSDAEYCLYLGNDDILVSNTDFMNCYSNVYTFGGYSLNARYNFNGCTFNSNNKMKFPHAGTGWSHSAFIIGGNNYPNSSITNCKISNVWIGMILGDKLAVLPSNPNIYMEDFFYCGIYNLIQTSSRYSFDGITFRFPTYVPTELINPNVSEVFGVYSITHSLESSYSDTKLTNCKFIGNISPILGNNKITGARLTNHSANTSPSLVQQCEFSNLNTGITHVISSPTLFLKNKFKSCGIGVDYTYAFNNGISTSTFNCNEFVNNQFDISTNHGNIIYENSNCASLRMESKNIQNIIDPIPNMDSWNKVLPNYNPEAEKRVYQKIIRMVPSEKKTLINDYLEDESIPMAWRPMIKQLELELDVPRLILNPKTKIGYSRKDSSNLHWLANTESPYSYDACFQLGMAYPKLPCKKVSSQISSNELDKTFLPYLGQNIPNPAIKETIIPLFVPKSQSKGMLEIRNVETGNLIKSISITEKGEVSIKLSTDDLSAGVYFYSLYLDDKKIDTKKMVILK